MINAHTITSSATPSRGSARLLLSQASPLPNTGSVSAGSSATVMCSA